MTPRAAADKVFANPLGQINDFTFDDAIAAVFDDMVSRSVPQYAEIQRMLAELALPFVSEGSRVYDLGCSTGTTLSVLHKLLRVPAHPIGIDNSEEMLERCRIPYRLQENRDLLLNAGFRQVDAFFKWCNFAGFVAVK